MNIFRKIILGFFLVFFAALFVGWNYVPYWISYGLSNKMGVPVSISYINLTPFSIRIYDFLVQNPQGFKVNKALDVNKTYLKASPFAFFKKQVVIDEITLSDIYVGLEIKSTRDTTGNWTLIIDNLNQSDPKAPSKGSSDDSQKFLIKKLSLDRLNIDLVIQQGNGKVQRLKTIQHLEFTNLTSEGPIVSTLTHEIMSQMLKQVFSVENLSNLLKQSIENPLQAPGGLLKSIFSFNE